MKIKLINMADIVIILLLILYSGSLIFQNLDFKHFSPFDEHTHFDYWHKVYSNNLVPPKYDLISQTTIDIWACSGNNAFMHLKCGDINKISDGPFAGESAATANQPIYYITTALISKILVIFSFTEDLRQLAKVSSAIWGVIGVCFFYILCRILGSSVIAAVISAVLIGSSSNYIYMTTVINSEIFGLVATILLLCFYFKYYFSIINNYLGFCALIFLSALALTSKQTVLAGVFVIFIHLIPREKIDKKIFMPLLYLILTLFTYLFITQVTDTLRGVYESNGLMKELLENVLSSNITDNTKLTFIYFFDSLSAPAWHVVHTPLDFVSYKHVLTFMLISGLLCLLVKIFMGFQFTFEYHYLAWIFSIISFPILMAFYLKSADFPFFFQPRYYLVFSSIGIIVVVCQIDEFFRNGGFKCEVQQAGGNTRQH